jgi:hypothetical protein
VGVSWSEGRGQRRARLLERAADAEDADGAIAGRKSHGALDRDGDRTGKVLRLQGNRCEFRNEAAASCPRTL